MSEKLEKVMESRIEQRNTTNIQVYTDFDVKWLLDYIVTNSTVI